MIYFYGRNIFFFIFYLLLCMIEKTREGANMLTKKQAALMALKSKIHLMQCPICFSNLHLKDEGSMVCDQHHTFDLSKKGYINFLKQAPKENYEKDLFKSRQEVIKAGMYEPLMEAIHEIVMPLCRGIKHPSLLDAGCGEGSHLNDLRLRLNNSWHLFGLDIAKTGIHLATDHRNDTTWLVGDLAQLPIADKSLDVILNILSPGHYDSFKRVLKDEGVVIKVIPQRDYLKEIRQGLYPEKTYSNEQVRAHFERNFCVIQEKEVSYSFKLTELMKPKLLEMTPLTWQSGEEALKALKFNTIRVSLLILVGKGKT